MKKGYYSLLQYFPSFDRDERMNIAVMLESPSYKYIGVKYLRNMDGRLRCFDPSVDPPMIRLVANQLEKTLKSRESQIAVDNINHIFSEVEQVVTKPKQIIELKCFFEEAYRTLWRVTEPKPLFLPESQQFDERLEHLYSQLVAPPNLSRANTFDKQYVRTRTEDAMAARKVRIYEADPVPGLDFKDNDFDGVTVHNREVTTQTFWQFASFDVNNVRESFDQIRLFMDKVKDVRARQQNIETAMTQNYFTTVLQPPKQRKDKDHSAKFETALAKLEHEKIRAFEVDNPAHYDRLAAVIREGGNPWKVRGLNN